MSFGKVFKNCRKRYFSLFNVSYLFTHLPHADVMLKKNDGLFKMSEIEKIYI